METFDSDMDDPDFRSKMDAVWSGNKVVNNKPALAPNTDYHDKTIIQFGKHRGKSLEQIPDDYFFWLYGQPNLDPRMKKYIETYLPGAKAKHH